MREPSDSDFTVPLEGVGDFVFAKKTLGDMIKIRSHYLQLVGGDVGDADDDLRFFGGFAAAYARLMVSCPAGWEDVFSLTPDKENLSRLIELSKLFDEKELSFRKKTEIDSAP